MEAALDTPLLFGATFPWLLENGSNSVGLGAGSGFRLLWLPVSDGWLLDFATPQTPGTDPDSLRVAVDDGAHALQVRLPGS